MNYEFLHGVSNISLYDCYNFQINIQQAHELTPEKLKQREVVHIDIANDPIAQADYKPTEDPTK